MADYTNFKSDSRYLELDYQTQIKMRHLFFKDAAAASEQYQAMGPEDQKKVYENSVFSAPDLTAPDARQLPTSPSHANSLKTASAAYKGDAEALEEMKSDYVARMMNKKLTILETLAVKPKQFLQGMDKKARDDYEKVMDQDNAKVLAYEEFVGKKQGKDLESAGRTGEFVGTTLDYIGWWATLGPLTRGSSWKVSEDVKATLSVKGVIGGTKLGQAVTSKVSEMNGLKGRAARWVASRGAPEIIDSLSATNIGMLRSVVDGELDQMIKSDAGVRDVVSKGILMFGKEFVQDYVSFLALYTLATPLRALWGVFGKGYSPLKASKKPMTDEAFDKARKYVFAGLGQTSEDFSRATPEFQAAIRVARERASTLANVSQLPPDDPNLRKLFSSLDMFDLEKIGPDTVDKWRFTDLIDGKTSKTGDWETTAKAMDDIMIKRNNTPLPEAERLAQAYSSDKLLYKEVLDIPVDKMPDNIKTLAKAFTPEDGVNEYNILWATGKLLEKAGLSPTDAKNVKININGTDFLSGEAINITIPKHITTPKAQKAYYSKIVDAVEDYAIANGLDNSVFAKFKKQLLGISQSGENGYSPLWTKYQVKQVGGSYTVKPDGQIEISTSAGVNTYPDDQSAARAIFQDLMQDNQGEMVKQVSNNAKINYGIKIKQLDDGTFQVSDRGVQKKTRKVIYKTMAQVLEAHPEISPKLPVSTMPKYIITDPGMTTAEVDVGTISGSTGSMMSFMNQFKDWDAEKHLKTLKAIDGRVLQKKTNASKYIVSDQNHNYKATFLSPSDAREAMLRTYKTIDDVRALAANKGGHVELYAGKWHYYDRDGKNLITASNKDTLLGKISKLEMREYVADDIVGFELPREAGFNADNVLEEGQLEARGINDVTARLMKPFSGTPVDAPIPKTTLKSRFGPRDITMKDNAKAIGDPLYAKKYHNIGQADRYVKAKANEANVLIHSAIGRISRAQQDALGEVLASGTKKADWERVLLDYKGVKESDLPRLVQSLDRVKVIFDDMKHAYGIDNWKWLTDYYPKIKAYIADPKKAANLPKEGDKAVALILGYRNTSSMPITPKQFSNGLRTDDLLVGSFDTNVFSVLDNYIRQGYRTKYLSPLIDDVAEYSKELVKKGFPNAAMQMKNYTDEVTGFFSDESRAMLDSNTRKVALKFYEKLADFGVKGSPESKAAHADVISFANSLTVSATMSLRPWLAIRNSFQPYVTLGPRIGPDIVDRAVIYAAKHGDEIIPRLRARGVVGEMNPMMSILTTNPLTKYNNVGMRSYGNSDAWTRGVCDGASTILMDVNFKKLKAGSIDMTRFVEETRISKFDQVDQMLILDALKDGGLGRAKDVYTDIMTKETMFPYTMAENPDLFKGVLGKMFGGYGHYSVNYAANMARGWKNAGNVGQKLGYAATVAGTSAALYGSFKYVLGIDARNFLFWTPTQFSGGPLWDLLNTALGSLQSGFEGNIAREKLIRDSGNLFIPGRAEFKSVVKGIKSIQEGDLYGAGVNFLSAPYDPNNSF